MSSEPNFDEPVQQPPKKPRKPMKKRRKMRKMRNPLPPGVTKVGGWEVGVKKRRGRPVGSKANGQVGKRYTREQYEAINSLLGMTSKERDAVLDIVKGLAK